MSIKGKVDISHLFMIAVLINGISEGYLDNEFAARS